MSERIEGEVLEGEVVASGKTVGNYAKGIIAALILVLGVFVTGLADGSMNTVEYFMAFVALLRGVLLFGVRPEWGKVGVYLPLIVTAVIGGVTQLITILQDGGGANSSEIVACVVIFLTGLLATYVVPNASHSDALIRHDLQVAGDYED